MKNINIMQQLSSVGYPKNMSYMCRHLLGYSRATMKLQAVSNTSASAGNIITVDLPSNSLVDLNTFIMFFTGTTTTTTSFANFPKNIESLIERQFRGV